MNRVDSLSDVSIELLTEEEKARLKKIKEIIDLDEDKPRRRWWIFRSRFWLYVVLLAGGIMFTMSVVYSSTKIREQSGNLPSCVVSNDPYRLPMVMRPSNYELYFSPNFEKLSFIGSTRIHFQVSSPTYCIYFHSKFLTLNNIQLKKKTFFKDANGFKESVIDLKFSVTENNNTDIVRLYYDEYLSAKRFYILEIEYDGYIRENGMEGWYQSTFQVPGDDGDISSYVFPTHFECSAARTVFPSLDEPHFKATFEISIEISLKEVLSRFYGKKDSNLALPDDFVVLSNSIIGNRTWTNFDNETKFTTLFEITPKMSTYLVAFVVGRMKNLTRILEEDSQQEERMIRVFLTPNNDIEHGLFALEVADVVTYLFGKYFDFDYFTHEGYENEDGVEEYKLKKMDLIGLPDFAAGAMENWGLITFREKYLINYDNENLYQNNTDEGGKTSLMHNITSAKVIAHEISHQWTGNLVTLDWWDETFINEGLTTFFEYFVMDDMFEFVDPSEEITYFFRDWPIAGQYVISELFPVLRTDSMYYSKSLTQKVTLVDECEAKFSTISYNKGSTIFRMIRAFLGDSMFRKFMVDVYFDKDNRLYSSESFTDLVDQFKEFQVDNLLNDEDENGEKKEPFDISPWLVNVGYPILTVEREVDSYSYVISQRMYYAYEIEEDSEINSIKLDNKWDIFVEYFTSSLPKKIYNFTLLRSHAKPDDKRDDEKKSKFCQLELPGVDWFKLNPDLTGYYRVNYPRDYWEKFISLMGSDEIEGNLLTEIDKVGLVNDAFDFAKLGILDIQVPFQMALKLRKKKSYLIFKTISEHISFFSGLLKRTSLNTLFNSFVNEFVDFLSNAVSWSKNEDNEDELLSEILIDLLIMSENSTAVKYLTEKYVNDLDSIPSGQRDSILKMFARNEDNTFFEDLVKKFRDTGDISLVYGMTQSSRPGQISLLLEMILEPYTITPNSIRSQDGLFVLRDLIRNPSASESVWNWMRENLDALLEKYSKQTFEKYVLPSLAKSFYISLKVGEMESFFEDKVDDMMLKQALEYTLQNVAFLKNNQQQLKIFLSNKYLD